VGSPGAHPSLKADRRNRKPHTLSHPYRTRVYVNADGKTSSTPIQVVSRDCRGVAKEFFGSALTILSIYGIRKLVEILLGRQLLWDFLPIRYCADTVDVAVFARFIWQVIRTFND
jgi:hypothetical protein